jgi:hypothetical protein
MNPYYHHMNNWTLLVMFLIAAAIIVGRSETPGERAARDLLNEMCKLVAR